MRVGQRCPFIWADHTLRYGADDGAERRYRIISKVRWRQTELAARAAGSNQAEA